MNKAVKPRTHDQVSLTSSLVALLAHVYNEQVFPHNFSLISFVCSCVRLDDKFKPPVHTTKFSLTSSLVALLAHVYNEQVAPHNFSLINFVCSCVRLHDKIFLDDDIRTFACSKSWHNLLLNKASCQGKTCQFILYTRANKACQGKTCEGKLGRMCAGLNGLPLT